MNQSLLSIVKRIISDQGEDILADPKRLGAVFKVYAQNEPKDQRMAFGRCIEIGAYQALKSAVSPEERRRAKAALLPQLQSKTGLPTPVCVDALDLLDAALPIQQPISGNVAAKSGSSGVVMAIVGGVVVLGGLAGVATAVSVFGGSGGQVVDEAGTGGDRGYDPPPDAGPVQRCSDQMPPPPQISTRKCAPPTDNECDGRSDVANMQGNVIPNGEYGNGFDDDCDGLVDEGCPCPPGMGPGGTKDCYMMPSSWTSNSTKLPVGWCAENSKGTMRCERVAAPNMLGGSKLLWDGECRGAMPPKANDSCASGDFNCDGVDMNPVDRDCSCEMDPVQCPVEPLMMSPFPDPADLTKKNPNNPLAQPSKPFVINGMDWVKPEFKSQVRDFEWELTGGDCDNILHYPTFALFGSPRASSTMLGSVEGSLGPGRNQRGVKTAPNSSQNQVYPAFSLSGDYILVAKFKVGERPFGCTVKIQVRAPGIRAEFCWHNTGNTDNDLHVARQQANTGSCSRHGWKTTCASGNAGDDVYFGKKSPDWGYRESDYKACHGWGSKNNMPNCPNPRLDKDNVSCVKSVRDPNGAGYCGPENVNIDNPNAGDSFLVGAYAYDKGTRPSYPHVNIYCNGERKLSVGYTPGPGPHYPVLAQEGDLWTAALVKWNGSTSNPCTVSGVGSREPNSAKDGSTAYCVDRIADTGWLFRSGGGFVTSASEACWH